jgi:hypothetical protein
VIRDALAVALAFVFIVWAIDWPSMRIASLVTAVLS